MDTYIVDETTNIHIPNVDIKGIAHTTTSIYLEGTTDDGMRVTIRLTPKEAEAISREYTIQDNEAWEAYKIEAGKRWAEEEHR